jgi:hypothetical protein
VEHVEPFFRKFGVDGIFFGVSPNSSRYFFCGSSLRRGCPVLLPPNPLSPSSFPPSPTCLPFLLPLSLPYPPFSCSLLGIEGEKNFKIKNFLLTLDRIFRRAQTFQTRRCFLENGSKKFLEIFRIPEPRKFISKSFRLFQKFIFRSARTPFAGPSHERCMRGEEESEREREEKGLGDRG